MMTISEAGFCPDPEGFLLRYCPTSVVTMTMTTTIRSAAMIRTRYRRLSDSHSRKALSPWDLFVCLLLMW